MALKNTCFSSHRDFCFLVVCPTIPLARVSVVTGRVLKTFQKPISTRIFRRRSKQRARCGPILPSGIFRTRAASA